MRIARGACGDTAVGRIPLWRQAGRSDRAARQRGLPRSHRGDCGIYSLRGGQRESIQLWLCATSRTYAAFVLEDTSPISRFFCPRVPLSPRSFRRALDVGCGIGMLACRLADHCEQVLAMDIDHDAPSRARDASPSDARITFIQGDVMTYPCSDGSSHFIAVVAALHHLPLN